MTRFSDQSQQLKVQIKADYLSGMEVPQIAKKYGFKYPRSVYFHLKPLSQEDKQAHFSAKYTNTVLPIDNTITA